MANSVSDSLIKLQTNFGPGGKGHLSNSGKIFDNLVKIY